ncbi:DinB family protein [Desertivirga xinjiangensis]|uniref:DinB family protein n=1 Tax=Desertivirga xinjiangensis TaxID=539206 RepID=UPI00210DFF13|nr:DinB family protein [Pedobacter xinjiangensis]
MELIKQQYEFIKSSRNVLFNYCTTLSERDFIAENSSFGKGSIRNLLVHIGNTYEFWIGKHALGRDIDIPAYVSISNIPAVITYFLSIDNLLEDFLTLYSGKMHKEINVILDNIPGTVSPLKLFCHVITHEFHHKGQILSLSRHLGYIPIDTDIIR